MENGILTAKETKEGNSLIAKFDGYTQKPNNSDIWIDLEDGHSWRKTDELIYDCDYSHLMSIVEKIAKLKINGYTPLIEITNFGCKIDLTKISGELKFTGVHGQNLITNVWIMVVNFLEWYYTEYDTTFNWEEFTAKMDN
jgi:hypothetical protein